jgi:large subunit ribosomal protein L18
MKSLTTRERRTFRTRKRIRRPVDTGRVRLSVFRSAKHIYAQIIDDLTGHTLAERAKAAGVSRVVFDRGPYRYHGRVKALAEGAREGGLEF